MLAKGENRFAQRIKAIAAEHGVPTVENKPVARAALRHGAGGGGDPAGALPGRGRDPRRGLPHPPLLLPPPARRAGSRAPPEHDRPCRPAPTASSPALLQRGRPGLHLRPVRHGPAAGAAGAAVPARPAALAQHRHVAARPAGDHLRQGSARVLGLPHDPARRSPSSGSRSTSARPGRSWSTATPATSSTRSATSSSGATTSSARSSSSSWS